MDDVRWRKSSRSNSNGGACVEVATRSDHVMVRDTKDRAGGMLDVPFPAWQAFTAQLRDR
ncbi:DUF397 domain-containing protein [Haloechinothrix sp. LS1_15]|uniref:DUF397 domain-containing protein n=1 Tax=Haloechinothrix sp. LS1_15 TaxID=2652248 RepID=UPI0029441E24|nr:DUF397 domain-containing protein [Haloechinothrix sp. LS1_15]MDV6013584.1 DUF397 domain-containing protein [Haloechinothrix sp. LS1_15]